MIPPKEHPIIFSGPMVRAMLSGTKTQTRRIVQPQPSSGLIVGEGFWWWQGGRCWRRQEDLVIELRATARWKIGDRLWVRETWQMNEPPSGAIYRADDVAGHIDSGWRPSIFMPRWASRITLEVTAVRVERLQDITEEDATREGCTCRFHFRQVWDRINGKRGSWASNPWVWVISFHRLEGAA